MGVETYSISAGANIGLMPENQAPATVNNGVRQVQADIAVAYNDAGWFRPGGPAYTPTYLSGSSFRVPGVDATDVYHAGRRARAVGSLTGTVFGTISNASYTGGNTDVAVTWSNSGVLVNEALDISLTTVGGIGIAQSLPFASTSVSGTVELATAAEWLAGTATGAIVPNIAAIVAGGAYDDTQYWRLTFSLPGNIRFELGAAPAQVTRTYLAPFVNARAALFVTPSHGTGGLYYATVTDESQTSFVPRTFDLSGNAVGIPVTYMAAGILA
jgi:hypothetical protein